MSNPPDDPRDAVGGSSDASANAAPAQGVPASPANFGPFEIQGKIGQGGMGAVFRARDTRLDRTVALKLISPGQSADPAAEKRLWKEARAAARLDHPNICSIYSVEEVGGAPCIVMQYLQGQTLKQKLAGGRLTVAECLSIALQAAAGLEEAHRLGVVHRDIKSSNLMVTDSAEVKIVDFGIARLSSPADATETFTTPGTTAGTLAYIAPEQLHGEPASSRTDVFSFGVVLYEMLTGSLPFMRATPAASMHAVLAEEPAAIREVRPEVPESFACVVARALCKKPEGRYRDAGEIRKDLQKVAQEKNVEIAVPLPRSSGWKAKNAWVIAAVAMAGVLLVWRAGPWRKDAAAPSLAPVRSEISGPQHLAPSSSAPTGKPVVAVLSFSNASRDPRFAHLEDGIADALAGAFLSSGEFTTVERNQLDRAIQELKLNRTEMVDPATAQKVGRIVGAQFLVIGSFQAWQGQIRVNVRMMRVETAEIMSARSATGPESEALRLPDQLARDFLRAMPLRGETGKP